jgi:hypothetical protein
MSVGSKRNSNGAGLTLCRRTNDVGKEPVCGAATNLFSENNVMVTSRSWSLQIVAMFFATFLAGKAVGQAPVAPPAGNGPPAFRGIEHTARNNGAPTQNVAAQPVAQAAPDHPLNQAVAIAERSLANAHAARDFAFTFVKRELVDNKLTEHESMFMKVRNNPFSVYVYTLGPKQDKGQEAIYVAGRYDDKIQVHVTGFRHKLIGTLSLAHDAPEIMEGNRYSMTSAGFVNMLTKISNLYRKESVEPAADSVVQVIPGAKVDGRAATCVQVTHPVHRPSFVFQTTRMFYDDQTGLPIRWEAYDFPTQAGQAPPLCEEYTYRNVQLNVGLTDADFDVNNPQYGYK